ncbi:cupin domain-containing protein [Duganella aceris]|jgi:uncharacterized cupin superfamily protein|uniref:Cupin domain-containing protein n=1 Tax=Duganella aceris TaxID=2703883 RepID=A0ABX0FKP5_9BURK|nr:cupin domain-containing protein [Duganella aceris]NGZ85164.1 cupin domain-containing protein [Duganella aceris]
MTTFFELAGNLVVQASAVTLDHASPPAGKILAGEPRIGTAVLGAMGDYAIGVWEITPSVTTDIEADEYFIVLSGAATVSFDDGSPALRLSAGSVGRLAAGTATIWNVTETLRKIYIA